MAKVHPRYEHMEFEDNGYQEYPKMVYPKGNDPRTIAAKIKPLQPGNPATDKSQGVLVNNPEEEKFVMDGGAIVREGDEKADLLVRAGILGVQVDKRWGVDKLKAAIEAAEEESMA